MKVQCTVKKKSKSIFLAAVLWPEGLLLTTELCITGNLKHCISNKTDCHLFYICTMTIITIAHPQWDMH